MGLGMNGDGGAIQGLLAPPSTSPTCAFIPASPPALGHELRIIHFLLKGFFFFFFFSCADIVFCFLP